MKSYTNSKKVSQQRKKKSAGDMSFPQNKPGQYFVPPCDQALLALRNVKAIKVQQGMKPWAVDKILQTEFPDTHFRMKLYEQWGYDCTDPNIQFPY